MSKYTNGGSTNKSAYQEAFYDIENNVTNEGLTYKVRDQNFQSAFANYDRHWQAYNQATTNMSAISNLRITPVDDGLLSKRWRMYDAYFRGIKVNPDGLYYRKDRMNIHGYDATNQSFEDIWFVDTGESMGNWHRRPGEQWTPDPTRSSRNNTGLQSWDDSSRIELSFGGIQPVKWMDDHDVDWWTESEYNRPPSYKGPDDETFFDLENGNTNYSTTQAAFVKNLSAGSQFRFRQDPNRTIYTIIDVEIINRCRYDTLSLILDDYGLRDTVYSLYPSYVNEVTYGNTAIYHQVEGRKGTEVTSQFANFGNNISQSGGSVDRIYRTSSFLRASNHTKSFRIRLNKPIAWDPVSNPSSPISGETVLILEADNVSGGGASGSNFVEVPTITGSGDNSNILTVGMVLESYDDGTEKALTVPAIVSQIDKITGGYKIWFKTYDGSHDWGTAGDERPDDIADGDALNFYQYPMNGLSPNSAKNLNFFREGRGFDDTYAGTDAIGYDFEFVEPLIDEDQLLPANPAIWETEPKELSSDIDIYYEASGALPISLNSDNFSSIIPLGSKVQLENSNIIPAGTTVTSVNTSTNEITLSNTVTINIPPEQQVVSSRRP